VRENHVDLRKKSNFSWPVMDGIFEMYLRELFLEFLDPMVIQSI
jgi:hypothetical protein